MSGGSCCLLGDLLSSWGIPVGEGIPVIRLGPGGIEGRFLGTIDLFLFRAGSLHDLELS